MKRRKLRCFRFTLGTPGFPTALSILLLACLLLLPGAAHADPWEAIQKRGTLVVGVKRDTPLWGQYDADSGELRGLEPDLAIDLGRQLGLRVELVGLLGAERERALETGRVDVVIAMLADTPQRRKNLLLVEPRYYDSGANVLAPRSAGFKDWRDLSQRRVCARRGASYNRPITVSHGIDMIQLYSNELALAALRDGRCTALVSDDTTIAALLKKPAWSAFEMPLRSLFPHPWAVALHRGAQGSRLESAVSEAIVQWHRAGLVLSLEKRWGIAPSELAVRLNALWSERAGSGWRCGETLGPSTPIECRGLALAP